MHRACLWTASAAFLLAQGALPAVAEIRDNWAAAGRQRASLIASLAGAAGLSDDARRIEIRRIVESISSTFWAGRPTPSVEEDEPPVVPKLGPAKVVVMPLAILRGMQSAFTSAVLMDDLAKAQDGSDDVVVELVAGTTNIEGLVQGLAAVGRADLATVEGGRVVFHAPIVVGYGASFVLQDPGTTLVLDSSNGSFLWNAGSLYVQGGTIEGTSAAPDPDSQDNPFRAFILASGAKTVLRNAELRHLGFEGIYTSGLSVAQSSGEVAISNSRLRDVHNVRIHQSSGVRITHSEISGSAQAALTLSHASDVALRGMTIWGDASHGITVIDGSKTVDVVDSVLMGNGGAGILVAGGSDNVHVTGNIIFGNEHAGIGAYEAGCLVVENNLVLGNAKDGISMRMAGPVRIARNEVVLNGWNGISVRSGSDDDVRRQPVHLIENRFSMNRVGVASDSDAGLHLTGNTFPLQSPRIFGDALQSFSAKDLLLNNGQNAGSDTLGSCDAPHRDALQARTPSGRL